MVLFAFFQKFLQDLIDIVMSGTYKSLKNQSTEHLKKQLRGDLNMVINYLEDIHSYWSDKVGLILY